MKRNVLVFKKSQRKMSHFHVVAVLTSSLKKTYVVSVEKSN